MKSLAERRARALGALLPSGLIAVSAKQADAIIRGGGFECFHNGVQIASHNIIPAAARSYLQRAGYAGASQYSSFFIAPFENFVEPDDDLTAANFNATLNEFTNYTQATRPAWTQDAEANGAIVNAGALASITADVGGGTIAGLALLTVATKSSGAGLLMAASLFPAERDLIEGDILQFRYTTQAQAAA